MKYEITKGSEKDFGICDDDIIGVYATNTFGLFYATKHSAVLDSWVLVSERRPITEPVWDGEGLPPVGCVCEYRGNDTSWGEVKIIGHDEGKVVFKPSGEDYYGITPSHKAEFIPIPSHEDVARDEAIEDIANVINPSSQSAKDILAPAIYDAIAAGKIKGVKLEGK